MARSGDAMTGKVRSLDIAWVGFRLGLRMSLGTLTGSSVRSLSNGSFLAFWTFIGTVSAIDTYLTARFQDLMWQLEQNRMGRFLIELGSGDVGIFIRTKIAGTVVVLAVLAGLHVYRRRWSQPVTFAIAAFQLGLLGYLTLSEPQDLPPSTEASQVAGLLPTPRTVWDDVSICFSRESAEPEQYVTHTR